MQLSEIEKETNNIIYNSVSLQQELMHWLNITSLLHNHIIIIGIAHGKNNKPNVTMHII